MIGFGENRDTDGWSPFSVSKKPVDKYVEPKPGDAVEVHPLVVMNNQKRALPQQVAPKEDEAEAPAEADPKALDLSAMNSAEASGLDSSMSSLPPIQTPESIHPSSLAPEGETSASVEKDQKQTALLAFTPMNLG